VLDGLHFRVSLLGARDATAGIVKLLLPPRQSRGVSFVLLERADVDNSGALKDNSASKTDYAAELADEIIKALKHLDLSALRSS